MRSFHHWHGHPQGLESPPALHLIWRQQQQSQGLPQQTPGLDSESMHREPSWLRPKRWGLQAARPLGLGWQSLSCGGVALFGSVLFGLPMSTVHLAQMQALNRELGKVCSAPPQQALSVCRLHARLLKAL